MSSGIEKFLPLWGEWIVEEKLGEGSFGSVYKAKRETYGYTDVAAIKHVSIPKDEAELNSIYDELGTRDVQAVKAYLKDVQTQLITEYRKMMEFEGNTNIVACHDIMSKEKEDSLGYDIFIRMELLESVSVRAIENKMTPQETIKLGIDICNALTLLQEHQMIHRDIKPQNLFVNERGDYKLGDFGTARSILGNSAQMSIKGTVAYMAPEVANRGEVSYTADIYSLGLVMYRLLNGYRTPFISPDESSSVAHIDLANERRLKGEQLPAPSEADASLSAIILKACAFDPKDRWQSAAEMREMLLELHRGTSTRLDSLTDEERKVLEKEVEEAKKRAKREEQDRIQAETISKKKKKKKRITIVISCVAAFLLLLAGAFVGYLFYEKNVRYNDAIAVYDEGNLEEALTRFEAMSGYGDTDEYIQKIHDEQNRRSTYAEARKKLDEGKYEEAQTLYEGLGEYQDAAEQAIKSADLKEKENRYQQALQNMTDGKYEDAYSQFSDLTEYRDAVEQAETARKWIKYKEADDLFSQGKMAEAKKIYDSLGDLGDAAQKSGQAAEAIRIENLYTKAVKQYNEEKYEEALEIFIQLGEYSDAPKYVEETQKRIDAKAVYARGQEQLEKKNYEEALKIFNSISWFSDAAGKAKEAEALINKEGTYKDAVLAERNGYYEDAKNLYTMLGDFSDAKEKAQEMQQYLYLKDANDKIQKEDYNGALKILTNLTIEAAEDARNAAEQGLKQQNAYKAALQLEKSGKYAEAKEAYDQLAGYKDAKDRSAEMQRHLDYAAAVVLRDEGKLEEALKAFSALGAFSDAPDQKAAIQTKIQEQNRQKAYAAALELEKEKKYEEALKAYTNLGKYEDAEDRAQTMSNWIKYIKAQNLMDEESYQEALTIYQQLDESFEDVKNKRKEAKQEGEKKTSYEQAVHYQELEQYENALVIFDKLAKQGYKDSQERAGLMRQYVNYNKAVRAYESQEYDEALQMFTELEDFSDSKQYLEKTQAAITLRGKQENYNRAAQLAREKKYEQALAIYKELGEYEDAAEQAVEMQNTIDYNKAGDLVKKEKFDEAIAIYARLAEIGYGSAESLKKQAEQTRANEMSYQQALSLAEQGEYQKAKEIFSKLQGYKDASDQADLMQQNLRQKAYAAAQELEKEKKYEEALKAYTNLGKYEDAEDRAQTMSNWIKYIKAQNLMDEESYQEALTIYQQLDESFEDVKNKRKEAKQEGEKKTSYEQAVRYQELEQYENALVIFDKLAKQGYKDSQERADLMRQYVNYNKAVRAYESREYDEALQMFTELEDFSDSKQYLEKTQAAITLRGKQENYSRAAQLAREGKYEQALTIYKDLGEYEDAAEQAVEMQNRIDYNKAGDLVKKEKFDEAIAIYTRLAEIGYGSAESQKKQAEQTRANEMAYQQALSLAEQGEYQKAKDRFSKLYGYKDASDQADLMQKHLRYQAAEQHLEKEEFDDAIAIFTELDDFSDAKERARQTETVKKNEQDYQSALELFEQGQYREAYHIFNQLGEYKEAAAKKEQSLGYVKYQTNGDETGEFVLGNPVTGENLLMNSALERPSENGALQLDVRGILESYVDLPITISFDAKTNGDKRTVTVSAYQASGISIADSMSFTVPSDKYDRYSFTTSVKDYQYKIDPLTAQKLSDGAIEFSDGTEDSKGFTIKNIKIEVGTKATPWGFAPGDPLITGKNLLIGGGQMRTSSQGTLKVDLGDILKDCVGQPVTVSFEAKAKGDSLRVRVSSDANGAFTLQETASIDVNSSGYQSYSFHSTVQANEGKSSPSVLIFDCLAKNRKDFSISKLKIEIGTEATAWSFAPNDPAVTGDNLLKDSALIRQAKNGMVRIGVADVLEPYAGMPICISFDAIAEGNEEVVLRVSPYQSNGISIEESHECVLTNTNKGYTRCSFTDRVRTVDLADGGEIGAYGQGEIAFISDSYKGFTIKNIKIEVGDHPTDWSFAPNDPLVTGDNLLVGGGQTKKSESGQLRIDVRDALAGSVGQPITISFEAKAEGSRAHMLEMSAYQESGISIADKYSFSVSSKQYKKFSFTTTVTDYGYKVNKQTGEMLSGGSISVSDLGTPTQEFSIRNLKIEVGVEPTDWKYAANDPVVTGDNLFRDSAKARQANDGFLSIPTRNILEPYTGMMICVSFDAKVNTENGFDIQVYPYQDSGISVDGSRTFHLTQEYARYTFVGQVKDFGIREKDGKKYSRGELAFYNKERQSFTVKNIKIEVGTKNTPWSFAPNDPLAKKTGVNLLVGGGMTRKSESGYVGINVRNALADYVGQPVTISFDVMMLGKESRTLRMYAYQDSGISIADKFEFQAVPKKYTRQKFTTTVADYGILADPKTGAVRSSGILSFFDPTSPKSKKQDFLIRNVKIEIGTKATEWSLAPNDPLMTPTGENLLVGGGLAKKSNGGGFLAIGVNNALTEYVGQPITVSFEAKMLGEESRTLKMYAYQDSGVSIADVFEFKAEPNQYQQYSFTTSVYDYGIRTAPDTGKQYSLGELAFLDASEAKQEFSIRHVKIELGYKATDWTFAANDPLVNGSNLLKDSAKVRHDQNGFLSVDVWDALEPYIGMPITVSFDAKSDTAEELPIRVYPYQNSGVSIETSHDFNLTTSYKRYSFVDRGYLFGKRPDDYGGKYSKGAIAFFNESHKEFSVKNVKIELGEVKNPLWCMAVDDPLNKIIGQNLLIGGAQTRSSAGGFLEVAVRDTLADYLDQPITISFEAMTVGEKSRTLQVYAYQTSGISIADREEFTVQPNQYQSFVMHTSVRDFGIRVNPDTGKMLSSGSLAFYDSGRQEFKIRNIKIEAGNEQSDWSYAPNDPVVSGENLLKNSARVRRSSENGFLSIPTADILAPYTGMTVCVSFEAKTNTGNEFDIEVYPYQESGVTVDGKQTIHLTSKYANYSYIGKVQDFGIREKDGQKFSAGEIGFYSKEHKIFSIRNVKIEVGLEPTPWSFAPGDPSVTGDNLLMDSAKIRTAPNGQLSIDVGEALEPYVGMPVCISFEAKAEKDDGLALQVSPYRNSGVTIEESHKVSLSTTYKRYTITDWVTQLGTAESTAGKTNFRGGISFSSTGSKGFSVKNIKIEVGVKPTDWSFAPNDTILTGDNLLKGGGKNRRSNGGGFLSIEVREALDHYVGQPVTISFEAMMEGDESCTLQMYAYQTSGISIADRAEFQVEPRKYQKFSFTTSVVNYGYRINSESGKRFSDGEIAFLDPGKTKHEFRIRNVKIEVGVEPTEWRYAADDPAINGENLLLDSAKVRQTGNGFLGVGIWEDLKSYEGQYVCISFDAKVNGNEGFPIKVYPYQESGLSIGSSKEFALTTDFSRYAFVTQIIDYGQRYEKGQRLSLGEIGFINSERRDFTVRNIKIEIGNKETPWTFAPRDPLLALKGANLLPGDGHARQSVGGFMEFNVFTALRKYENQPVTISFDACMLGNESRTLRMYPYQTSGISIADSFEFTVNPGAYQTFKFTTWVRNFGIRTDTSGNQYTNGSIGFYDPTLQREGFDIRRLKIEIGTEKTPWSPGPMTEESTSGAAE